MTPYTDSIEYVSLNMTSKEYYDTCFRYFFYPKFLDSLKEKGYDEMWVFHKEGMDSKVIAVSKNGKMEIYEGFSQELLKVGGSQKTFNKAFLPVILDIDAILEKISKYGIDSITDEEKKYLDTSYQ